MTQEELRIRSLYLFLACSQAIDEFKGRLIETFPAAPLRVQPLLERSLKRELGLLFRYWITRQVWERVPSEEDAKSLNLAVLRLFTDGFKLARDGSGLRYAELSTLSEEVNELSHRITNALGTEHQPLLAELHGAILPWRDAVMKYTTEALELPLPQLTARVKAWAERAPEPQP